MDKEMAGNAVSGALAASSSATTAGGGVVAIWTWFNGHDISWWVGVFTIVLLLLQIRDRLFPRRTRGGAR
ncbi:MULTISPECIES: hypothetical protein [Burkholderia]|uniref:Uncharacterized protein n=1 Tax=Burkholderia contaminans TaxID=488447 RepID=A0A2S5DRR9_9BURK|nr:MULTISPECIES: hypothetical protein [Burkholderia]EKS9794815.1 hypothetical protein [Burkholderia cepacia]EKS9802770.1 hypothetical protein [Burkholderia cepacia]EKS9809277.1 hypothetical protein [Burkholderia cepacia]EKS9818138.1 hypothetical protein [Burkholderia cepacia]EKS9824132.1 hypothetical protein [Burkholderia cepacia]